MSTLHRPVAMGTVATLLAAVALVGISSTAHAEESSLPGIELSVPAADVTDSDSNLASAAREVVAIVDGPDGPEVLKLRAQTQAEAAVLADELDSRPEVTAETNRVFTTPTVDTTSRGPAKPAGSFDLTGAGGYRTSSVSALGAEPFGVDQWGLSAVHADGAWTVTRGGGVTVAVVDSGVDATHPDLAGRVLPQIDLVDDPWTGDPTGHGTHVAGIIAASLDGAGVAGLANEVNILPIRVMDATGAGDFLTIASGIVEATDQGAKVINLSLGSEYSSDIITVAVEYAVDSGVTVIAAGGNSYAEGNPVSYPAALPGVVAVSSVNRDGQSSVFANAGSYIDIAAPGEDILSTVPGGGWDYHDGTSMAAPFVAATAALVRVANPTLTKTQVDTTLLATARDDADGDGRDNWFGHGILQADQAALTAAHAPGGLQAQAPGASTKVKATSGQSKLSVDVNPNKGTGYWTFQVHKQRADGTWSPLKTYKTHGGKETRTINLPKGTYQVVVNAKYGHQGTTSAPVYLKK